MVILCARKTDRCKKHACFFGYCFPSRSQDCKGPPDSPSPPQVSMSYRRYLWIFQITFSHDFGSLSCDLWRRLFHRLCCSSGLRFASYSQPKFIMASLYPFVLLPALSFSLNSFSPSLVFTPSDVFIDYNHIPSWPFFSEAKHPSASGLLWEHRLSIPLFGLIALLCSHCRPKSLFLHVFSWPVLQ